jgi:anti-sigma B factor antagonist
MNKPSATLMVAVLDRAAFVKISGRANFTLSLDFKKLLLELTQRGYKRFFLELTDCVIMDSTFLGVLAGIGLELAADKSPQLELVNPNERLREVLENLGILHLFHVLEKNGVAVNHFEPVAADGRQEKVDVTRNCLEAHELLMRLNPDNVCKFKDVAEFFAEDLKKLESGS